MHDYWECPYWKADKEVRDKGQKGKAAEPKKAAAAEPTATASPKK